MNEMNILPFLNEEKIHSKLFENENEKGDPIMAYINLSEISKSLEFRIKYRKKIISIFGDNINTEKSIKVKINWILKCISDNKTRRIDIDIRKKNNHVIYMYGKHGKLLNKENWSEEIVKYIENNYYIQFGIIRYFINGSFKIDNKTITLYTKNYERKDIPATLDECYLFLDKLLNEEDKKTLTNNDPDDLDCHFGIGMWIRNNWISPGYNRIDKEFRNIGFFEDDDKSSIIIKGYHHYLNGEYKNIEELSIGGIIFNNNGHST